MIMPETGTTSILMFHNHRQSDLTMLRSEGLMHHHALLNLELRRATPRFVVP